MDPFTTLRLAVDAPISRLTLSRPERLNALSPHVLSELITAAEIVGANSGVKVVIVGGAGRAFCAGFDLDTVGDRPAADQVDLGRRMADAVSGIPALTIAAIHGHCVGGALVLAAACDIRIAAESTRFAIPEVDLGIPLAWGGFRDWCATGSRPDQGTRSQLPAFHRRRGPCHAVSQPGRSGQRSGRRGRGDGRLARAKPAYLIRHTKQLVDALVEDAYSTRQLSRWAGHDGCSSG